MEIQNSEFSSGKRKHADRALVTLLKCTLFTICGVIYGFSLHKAYVTKPLILQQQMYFKRVTLITFTLSAISTSMLIMSLIAMLPSTNHLFMISCNKFYHQLSNKGILSSSLGGLLMGIGFTVAGSTPTVLLAQIGAGIPNSGYALAGGLVATCLYGLLMNRFSRMFKSIIKESSNPWANSPYFVLALPLVAMFGITACGFETLRPHGSDIKVKELADVGVLSQRLWPAYLCGILIGIVQLPMFMILHQPLGISRGYRAVVSLLSLGRLPISDIREPEESRWWMDASKQILLLFGITVGGFIASSLSGSYGSIKGVDSTDAFWGGFLLLFGANIAGGCTSTHGISGMGLLSILSFITMCCVWVGGVATAVIVHWHDVYNFIPSAP